MIYSLFLSCPKGLEYLLEEEARALGLKISRVSPYGVYGETDLAGIYTLCLWSRIANRVLLNLFSGDAHNEQMLYQLCHQFPWQTVFSAQKTLAIEFHGSSAHIRNTMFGAQVVKDAIVDHFRQFKNIRPTIDKEKPEIRLHAYLKDENLSVSFDLTGYSLHQRGYRTQAGEAPLKENIAAAMLMRAKWPMLAHKGYALQDPFCGSGTLVIEAAMMAAHIAPGLIRHDQALVHWAQHQPSLWEKMRTLALQQVKPNNLKFEGTDNNPQLIHIAKDNASRAGVLPLVNFSVQAVKDSRPIHSNGLVISNPPYGERLAEATQLIPLYQELGANLYQHFQGYEAAILTSNPMLAKAIGLRAIKQYSFFNGPIACKLYCFSVDADNKMQSKSPNTLSSGAQMLANRLKKNADHLQKWIKRNRITCYRIYDADLPEYAYAIDIYNDYAVLQEYVAPSSIPEYKTEKRSLEVLQALPVALGIAPDKLIVKQRRQQKGTQQYQRVKETKHSMTVVEGQAKLKLNLYDYLDTGLFLDHRIMRLRFATLKPGTRFLNCFCYTASASIHAALAGALTTNVDLSKTYLRWAEDNFRLNHLDPTRHQFIHFDCVEWLKITRDKFDVIFLDPPSFSNSKRMTGNLDLQRDQEALIHSAMRILKAEGLLYFSTNLRHFKLSEDISEKYEVQDISAETIDLDFKRNKRIHQCYKISHNKSVLENEIYIAK